MLRLDFGIGLAQPNPNVRITELEARSGRARLVLG